MAVLAAGPRLGFWKPQEPETQGGGQAGALRGSAEKPGGEVDREPGGPEASHGSVEQGGGGWGAQCPPRAPAGVWSLRS